MPAWRNTLAPSIVAALALHCGSARSQSFADRLIGAYASLDSYCDRNRTINGSGDAPVEQRQCVTADGRFKVIKGDASDPRGFEISWADTEFGRYYFSPIAYRNESYGETRYPAAERFRDVAPIASFVLAAYWLPANDLAALRQRLEQFEPAPELSTSELEAYESNEPDASARFRIWISRTDGLIRRVAWAKESTGGFEVNELRVNEPLTDADLTFDAPFRARLNEWLNEHLFEIGLALSIASYVCGFVYWRARWRTRRADPAAPPARNRACSVYWKVVLCTVPPAFLYALFAPTGGDMSGAALLIERIAWALFYVYLLWVVALFIAARHFVKEGN